MSTLQLLLLVLPSIFSCVISALYAYIAYQSFKRPKDEIWEAALKIVTSSGNHADANQFAKVYEELKFFKQVGYTRKGKHLVQLMHDSQSETKQSQLQDTESL